uniref:Dynactin domain-containing protein n=1 Tax=Syphacia muris TaxID=451379 RepID=A0A0N5AAZ2_9BILA
MSETNELEWLRIQHKDLSEKLETLRQKRKEDHIKLLELERCRIQIQGLEEFKVKMCEAHKDLQKKLQEKEAELRQLEMKKTDDDSLAEIEERLELVTLDREMAEEKAEILQAELDAQKEKVAELEMELEILKSEMERQVDTTENQNAVVKVKQLEQQNAMLREAVVKLRDALGQAVDDRQEAKKDNETLREENAAFFKLVEKSKEEAKIAQEMIVELREQVDAVMGSEEMIEKLTEKNLGMEEKIHSLEEAIEDLEALHAMDEEIVETQKETEKDLRLELDEMQCKIAELNRQVKADLDMADEHDKVVQKFRQKISELNHSNQDYTDQILRLKEQLNDISNGELGPETTLDLISASHMFAEEVEKEMKTVDLESALQRASYLEAFLPDNFSKAGGDNDAVILNVLFPRLSHKALSLSKLLSLKYPAVPGGLRREHVTKSHKSDQWAHAALFTYYLSSLITVIHKFQR